MLMSNWCNIDWQTFQTLPTSFLRCPGASVHHSRASVDVWEPRATELKRGINCDPQRIFGKCWNEMDKWTQGLDSFGIMAYELRNSQVSQSGLPDERRKRHDSTSAKWNTLEHVEVLCMSHYHLIRLPTNHNLHHQYLWCIWVTFLFGANTNMICL